MFRKPLSFFLPVFIFPLFLLGSLIFLAVVPPTAVSQSNVTGLTNLDSTPLSLSFTLNSTDLTLDEDGYPTAVGLANSITQLGAPALPYFHTAVAVPSGHELRLTVTESDPRVQTVGYIPPVGQAVLPYELLGMEMTEQEAADLQTSGMILEEDPRIYGQDALYPAEVVEYTAVQNYRGAGIANVRLYPVRYNPTTGELRHIPQLHVTIEFVPVASVNTITTAVAPLPSLDGLVLNPAQAAPYQAPTASRTNAQSLVTLPVGQTVLKIQVDEDGLYEISPADLVNAGFANPLTRDTIQFMHNGQSVAYQFIDSNGNNLFDGNDRLRFYGQAWQGSRAQKFFITDNIYWLWDGGTPSLIGSAPSTTPAPVITQTYTSETFEEDVIFDFTRMGNFQWNLSPNEPDAWYWLAIATGPGDSAARNVPTTVTLTHPVNTASSPATIVAEYQSITRYNATNPLTHTIGFEFNGQAFADAAFMAKRFNGNGVYSPTHSLLQHGTNNVLFRKYADNTGLPSRVILNRITVDYWQHLIAINQEKHFAASVDGNSTFQVQGFTVPANQALVWDVTNPYQPRRITGAQVNSNVLSFGQNHTAVSRYLATTLGNIRPVKAISTYSVTDAEPATGYADWVAITTPSYLTDTARLAAHRASYSGLETHVVLLEDLFNQYAYGFQLPHATQTYMRHAQQDWSIPPQYLLLVGDADVNPRLLECGHCLIAPSGNYNFSKRNPEQMPPFYSFGDNYQGLIPTDHPYAMLTDDNLYPTLAVGRLSVETPDMADYPAMGNHIVNVVDKIIQYEQNLLDKHEWQRQMLFLYDDTDSGGNFKASQIQTIQDVPLSFNPVLTGFTGPPASTADPIAAVVRATMASETANGTTLVNWRGHGSVNNWGVHMLTAADIVAPGVGPYQNLGLPVVNISMDCLDGYFALPGFNAISEQLLRMPDGYGVAAHWSSTGLGLLSDHSVLAAGFYQGLFEQNHNTIGDAINYSKARYISLGRDPIEIYSFLLQGDPAMQLFRPELSLDLTASPTNLGVNQNTTAVVTLENDWIYPYRPTITTVVPDGLDFITYTSNVPLTLTQEVLGGDLHLTLELHETVQEGESAILELTLLTTALGSYEVTAQSSGEEINLTPGQLAQAVTIQVEPLEADFSSSSPDTVGQPTQFTNLSTGAVSYEWDFGDGLGSSTAVNPTYTYNATGIYDVTLIASDGVITASVTYPVEIVPVGVLTPSAAFSHTAPNTIGEVTQFTNLTEDGVNYEWDFGDGTALNTAVSPTHIYTTAGVYQVTLTAYNGDLTDIATHPVTITAPIAAFSSNSPQGVGQPTEFTNLSTDATSYAWDFGDESAIVTATNPVHIYNAVGVYTVTLTAYAAEVSDTAVQTVTILNAPIPAFIMTNPTTVGAPTYFTNQSVNAASYLWDFGDNSTPSTAEHPVHIYNTAGTYTVTLLAMLDIFTATVSQQLVVSEVGQVQPTADFSSNSPHGLGTPTQFTNRSVNALSYTWNFGDGSPTSTAVNPTHTYGQMGTYLVTLVASNGSLEHVVNHQIIITTGSFDHNVYLPVINKR